MMRPDCSCKTWVRSALPCKHILAVIIHDNAWSWEKLPSSYTESPYFNIDYDFVNKIVGNSPIITPPSAQVDDQPHLQDSDQGIITTLFDTLPMEKGGALEPDDLNSSNETHHPSPDDTLDQDQDQEIDQGPVLVLGRCQAVLKRLHSKIASIKDENTLETVLSLLNKTEIAIDRSMVRKTVPDSLGTRPKRRKLTRIGSQE